MGAHANRRPPTSLPKGSGRLLTRDALIHCCAARKPLHTVVTAACLGGVPLCPQEPLSVPGRGPCQGKVQTDHTRLGATGVLSRGARQSEELDRQSWHL